MASSNDAIPHALMSTPPTSHSGITHHPPETSFLTSNIPEHDSTLDKDEQVISETLEIAEDQESEYMSIQEEIILHEPVIVFRPGQTDTEDIDEEREEDVHATTVPYKMKPPKRPSKVFTRLVTFMRPLKRSVSRSFNIRRHSTSTDVITLHQFTEALSCRTEILPKRIYKVLRNEQEEVTKDTLVEATKGERESGIRFAFDVYDLDGDGEISEEDYRAALQACLEENRIYDMDPTIIEKAVEAFMTALDDDGVGAIQYESFKEFVECSLDDSPCLKTDESQSWQVLLVPEGATSEWQRLKMRLSKWAVKLRFRILNNLQKYSLWTVTILSCIGCFYWRFAMYAGTDKQKLMSWSLPIAKGMGQVMKFCFSVILIPVSRNAVTWARNSWLSSVLPFDDAIAYHKFIGVTGFVAATVHTACHVADVLNWSDTDRSDLYEKAFPNTHQPSFWELCRMQVAITGMLLYLIMCVAYLFALDYPRRWERLRGTGIARVLNNFNNFWYTHHLFTVFYILLLIHPSPGLPGESKEWGVSDFWLWGGVPIIVYVLERMIRIYRQGSWQTRILCNGAIAEDTVTIYLSKPRRFNTKAGMYIFLNCPEIAKFEWHPYTMTSAPQDDHIRVHIANLGDWSAAMCKRFKHPIAYGPDDMGKEDMERTQPNTPVSPEGIGVGLDLEVPFDQRSYFEKSSAVGSVNLKLLSDSAATRIFLDGPYGAPSQGFDQFSTVMLIGAGIGITPFASIIRDILSRFDEHRCTHCGKVSLRKSFRIKKVYFIWVVRDPQRALWFNKELYALKRDDQHGILDIQIFITGIHPENDVRSKLLHMTQQALFERCEIDLLTGARACTLTNFGRPNWSSVFDHVRRNHPRTTVGVFFCGQFVLSQTLEKNCRKYSDTNGTKFEYMYERF